MARGLNLPRLWALLPTLRWGIGARLGVAFAAVAGLALAANLLAEHEIAVISTTRLVPVAVSATPISVSTFAAPASVIQVLNPDALIAAIEQYQNAIRAQAVVHNEESNDRLDDALRVLRRESQAFSMQIGGNTAAGVPAKLRERLTAYRDRGDDLARIADSRQQTLAGFSSQLDALVSHVQSAIDRAWKIFDRVIARKTLIDLKASADDMRHQFANLPTTDDYDRGALDAVTASESAFGTTLQKNFRELAKSQGDAWMTQVRADLANLESLQGSLIQTDAERRGALQALSRESESLIGFIRSIKPLHPVASAPPPLPLSSSTLLDDLLHDATSTPPRRTIESTSTSQRKSEHAALIGWLSVAVLGLTFVISIWTVMSIVGPVRRIRSATRRLAMGDASVQVARGGIQELDELAVSFNQMAEQLATAQLLARTYQDQLEAKVAQRTRQLQELAEHDPLTQLPNRRQLFSS